MQEFRFSNFGHSYGISITPILVLAQSLTFNFFCIKKRGVNMDSLHNLILVFPLHCKLYLKCLHLIQEVISSLYGLQLAFGYPLDKGSDT